MSRLSRDVTDAELAVLQVLWERQAANIRQITDILYAEGTASQYATVQKLLERLEAKGYVQRDRSCWPHLFTALVDRGALIGFRLRAVADKLCSGSLAPLLAHLVASERLGPEERQVLRSRLEELERQGRR